METIDSAARALLTQLQKQAEANAKSYGRTALWSFVVGIGLILSAAYGTVKGIEGLYGWGFAVLYISAFSGGLGQAWKSVNNRISGRPEDA